MNTKLGKLNCECIWYTISLAFLSCIFRSRHDRRSRRGNEHSLFSRILRVQDASGLWSKLVVRWPLCDDKRIVGAPSSIGGWFIHWRMVHPLNIQNLPASVFNSSMECVRDKAWVCLFRDEFFVGGESSLSRR